MAVDIPLFCWPETDILTYDLCGTDRAVVLIRVQSEENGIDLGKSMNEITII